MPAPVTLFNVNRLGKLATRDGGVGANAHLFLPFLVEGSGHWYASGQILTFPYSTIPQEAGLLLQGRIKANTFQKDCCSCL